MKNQQTDRGRGAANRQILKVREIRGAIAAREQYTEGEIAALRLDLKRRTAKLRRDEKIALARLEAYYRANRTPNEKSIRLQDGTIGERVVPRVEIPKSVDVDSLPAEAVSVSKRVNKTALAALGDAAMAAAGARIVRPSRFYVDPAEEEASR
jgi:hypothetical protein